MEGKRTGRTERQATMASQQQKRNPTRKERKKSEGTDWPSFHIIQTDGQTTQCILILSHQPNISSASGYTRHPFQHVLRFFFSLESIQCGRVPVAVILELDIVKW